MIRRDNDRLVVAGPANLASAAALLRDGAEQVRAGARSVDLREVTELDSSLLAALLAWKRLAREAGGELRIVGAPPGLRTIAELYGVTELLGADAAS
ncbi:MAG: STAS domain-containing protein [Betaproteobacteria bacterium]|nr:STAS domain-containing protein [Betaproteobacteria bacterium]